MLDSASVLPLELSLGRCTSSPCGSCYTESGVASVLKTQPLPQLCVQQDKDIVTSAMFLRVASCVKRVIKQIIQDPQKHDISVQV